MADAYGNVLYVPGTSAVSVVSPEEILFSYAKFTQKGVTLKKGQGVIAAGTLLARETATKKYVKYNDAGSGGAEVAKGVLRQSVDTTNSDYLGNIVISGILKYDKLTGVDANANTDLKARVDTDMNTYSF